MTREMYLEKFKFRVFPCITNEKRPAISDWRNQATVKNAITGNYGVLASGHPYKDGTIVVVDLDNHSEKEESGVQFWEKNDFPADTFTVETPSGGKHLYYLASKEQIKEIEAIGGFKLHPQIDFFWQDNHYILGVGSVINGKEYKVINENEPSDLPECVIGLLRGFNGFRERPRQDAEKPRERKRTRSRFHEYERELILRELEKQKNRFGECKEDRGFYDEWFRLACSLKNSGFDVEDFQRLSYDDEATQRKCVEVWNSINREERGMGSLIYDYLPDWNNIKWRYDKLEDIAIEKALKMFPNIHKLEVSKDVVLIDDDHIEKSTLKDYKNTYAVYKKKQYRIDYPEKSTSKVFDMDGRERTRQTITFKERDAFPVFYDNTECLKGRITDPNYPYGVVEIKGKRFFNDFERVNLVEGNGTYDLFFDHLKNNICSGDETSFTYLKMWIFSVLLYQRPKTAICLVGNQGVGKTLFGQVLSMFFLPRFYSTINSTETLSNRFDSGFKRCFLVQIEEAMFSSPKYKNVWQKLKDLITSDTTSIERKGFDMEKIENRMNFIVTGNDLQHIAPVEKGNRRYVIFKVNDNHRLDYEYFREMLSELRAGGLKKMWALAEANREAVANFNFQNIPENEASLQNMVETAPQMLQWLLSKLEEFSPEEGYDDMPFIEQDGEILLNSNDLIDLYCSETGESKKYYTAKKVSGWLKDWTGKETEKRDYAGHKNLRCLCFRSVSDLIRSISATYFGGKNPLKIDI